MSTETIRLIKDGEKRWGGGGEGAMEVGREGDYIPVHQIIYLYTSPPE